MQTKPLLYGLIGFFIGGFIVSVAATLDKNEETTKSVNNSETTMNEMVESLKYKKGDDYDKAFIDAMIAHHEGAIQMAKLSARNAKHEEITVLSEAIIAAQHKEIVGMKQWQKHWGYSPSTDATHRGH